MLWADVHQYAQVKLFVNSGKSESELFGRQLQNQGETLFFQKLNNLQT